MRARVLACALVVMLSHAASAGEVLAASGYYWGPPQVWGVCKIYNAGSTAVTLLGMKIVDKNGSTVMSYGTSGDGSLKTGYTCTLVGDVLATQPYACLAVANPGKASLRGLFELRDNQQHVLASIDLR